MKTILEYLSTKVAQTKIKATNENIYQIVKDELDRLGHDADLNHIDVNEVTNMYNLFSCMNDGLGSNYEDLNPDISKWDVSNVEDMQYMFNGCKNFNQDLSEWDTKNVKTMHCMFDGCINFNQDISRWDVGKVEDMCYMFRDCKKFYKDLSMWNVSKVKKNSHMFEDCFINVKYKPRFRI